jgi:hypothetical protein
LSAAVSFPFILPVDHLDVPASYSVSFFELDAPSVNPVVNHVNMNSERTGEPEAVRCGVEGR